MNHDFLIIGALPHKNKQRTFGGVTVLNQRLKRFMTDKDINFIYLPLNKFIFPLSSIFNVIYLFVHLLLKINKVKCIFLNATYKGIYYISPIIYILSKIINKKFIIRIFAGNFDQSFENSNWLKKIIIKKTIFKSDAIFVETKFLLNFLKNKGCSNVSLLHNARSKPSKKYKIRKKFNNKFVFISHVKITKGIIQILEASKKIKHNYCIDVYGPFKDRKITEKDFTDSSVKYKGVLNPDDVVEKLLKYDVLILPTFHNGEGYPGVILEAFSVGMPIISTKWRSIPEIVNSENGILIEPKNTAELINAIESFDDRIYQKLSQGSLNSFQEFDENIVYNKLIKDIEVFIND